MKKNNIILIFLLVLLDQLTKYICILKLKPISSFEIIKDFFYLTYVENSGVAFGLFSGARYVFIFITIIILIFCFKYYKKTVKSKIDNVFNIALDLIIAGAIGNLLDRIFRGYVVDMLHFVFFGNDFAVFNIADALVVSGTILIIIAVLLSDFKGKKVR